MARSDPCSLAHGKILSERFLGPDAVCTLAAGAMPAALDEADAAVVELARKVAGDASSVTEADIDRCRAAGSTDAETLEVVPALGQALTFERPIA